MNQTSNLADQAAQSAENAIRSTQRVANETVDQLADSANNARNKVTPVINRVAGEAEHLAHRGMDALRDSTAQIRDKAARTSDDTIAYIKDEPIKAVLIAAASGAALMALASLLSRSHGRH